MMNKAEKGIGVLIAEVGGNSSGVWDVNQPRPRRRDGYVPRLVWKGGSLAKELVLTGRLEGVADVLNGRGKLRVGPEDGHDIETTALFEQVITLEEVESGQCEPPLLLGVDRLGGLSMATGLHLDEDESVALSRDQVNLPKRSPVPAHQEPEPLTAQAVRSLALAAIAEQTSQQGAKDAVHNDPTPQFG